MKKIPLIFVALLLANCGGNGSGSGASLSNTICYPWITVNLQKEPSFQSAVIEKLNVGEPLLYTGKFSNVNMQMVYRCQEFNAPWYEVIRKMDGKTGWVHGGTLSTQKIVLPVYDKIVIGYNQFMDGYSNYSSYTILNAFTSSADLLKQYGIYYKVIDRSQNSGVNQDCVPIGDGPYPSGSLLLNLYLKAEYGFSNTQPGYLVIELGKQPKFITLDVEADNDIQEIYAYFEVFSSGQYVTPELQKVFQNFQRFIIAYNPHPDETNDLWMTASDEMTMLADKAGIPVFQANTRNEDSVVLKGDIALTLTNFYHLAGFFYRPGFFFFFMNNTPIYIRVMEGQEYQKLIEGYYQIKIDEEIIDVKNFGNTNK
jgi:hypothetical protein